MYSDVQKSYYTTKKPFNHLSETYSSAVKHVFINICLKTRSFYNNIFDMSIVCPNHSLHSFKQWFYLFFFFFALFEDSHYCSCLQSIPERQSCDVTVCFALFLRSGDCGGKAMNSSTPCSSSDLTHNPGAASIHVRINVLLQNSAYAQPKAKKSDKTLQYKVALLFCWYVAEPVWVHIPTPVYFHYSLTLILQTVELMSSQKLCVCNWEVKTLINL